MKRLYGSGLRLIEGLRLRVKDVDFAQQQIVVRNGKGSKSRVTMLPGSVAAELRDHLVGIQRQHQRDLSRGFGAVNLPFALERNYPNANREWIWQYMFPSGAISKDPRNGLPVFSLTAWAQALPILQAQQNFQAHRLLLPLHSPLMCR